VSSETIGANYDVAVVGAGPAGLAAAGVCARAKLSTVIFDEQPSPGGQIYRSITTSPHQHGAILGEDYWRGSTLVEALRTSGAHYVPNASVWSLTPDLELGVAAGGGVQLVKARRVILCTGAIERPFPIPGWTLPGVMTAGAAQILLKSSALVTSGRTVLAGCGPLLWLLAWQYLQAGRSIDLILDTTATANRRRALPYFASFLFSPYLAKGLQLLREVRARIRVVAGVSALRALGEGKIESIAYCQDGGAEQQMKVDTLLLHQGVVPNLNLALSAGIEHTWDDAQLCFVPRVDASGASAVEGITIAGDGAGIAGAQVAQARGLLAGIAAVRALDPSAPAADESHARGLRARYERGRKFLDTLYRPAEQFRIPQGETIVCRCEEVSANQINEVVKLGCPGPNQMKAFLRCGMGPCQGRLCGLTVTELMAAGRGVLPQAIGYYRLRPPVKPITVAEMASLPRTEADLKAVVRI
jgi:NADPH-dependent 2,4-dienoyl-CoA reductase/sulfur reductase-like enzyme